jgi:hypothetical protein
MMQFHLSQSSQGCHEWIELVYWNIGMLGKDLKKRFWPSFHSSTIPFFHLESGVLWELEQSG